MNKCMERDIQEMLPDLLHRTLAADARERVEAHLATCDECREDLEVLRAVKAAAIFAPSIDVDRVVRQIPPYRTIVPVREVPARSRAVAWLVAASLAVVVAGGGSVLLLQQNQSNRKTVIILDPGVQQTAASPESVGPVVVRGGVPLQPRLNTAPPHAHALALVTDVEGLSDTGLRQLMNDMDRFDALPAAEPEPVISVDSGDSLDQDIR